MTLIIIVSIVLGVASTAISKMGIRTMMLWMTTLMFCSRRFGYFITIKTLLILECVGLSLSVITQLMLKRLNVIEQLMYILIRLIFLGIVYYETVTYIYITEEIADERA